MTHILTQIHDDENIANKEGFNFLIWLKNDTEKENFIREIYKKQDTRLGWNRLKWFIELADDQKYDAVRVFFLIALCETNIKILENRFEVIVDSTEDIKKFFNIFSVDDREFLESKFLYPLVYDEVQQKVTFDNIVKILINVRHEVVHGKNHYQFIFNNHFTMGKLNKKPFEYDLCCTYDDLKNLIIKYAVMNIKNNL